MHPPPAETAASSMNRILPYIVLAWLLPWLAGCASLPPQAPEATPDSRARQGEELVVREVEQGKLKITLEVLDREHLQRELGVDLTTRRIHALWVEVDNRSDDAHWLLRTSLDWDYYPVNEILYSLEGELDAEQLATLSRLLSSRRFRNPIPPHGRRQGYIFISSNHLNRLARLVILGEHGAWEIPVFLNVPELQGYLVPSQSERYPAREIVHTDEAGLRKLLETLSCCTTDATGKGRGDPLNLVIVGTPEDLRSAFAARSWHTVELNYLQSARKTIESFLFGSRYRYSPVSPLYLFGRPQDYAVQKARSSIVQRNHLRLWLTPWMVDGKPVWVGQVSRDIGVHATTRTPIFFTHKIDPDVDEDRNYLVEDLLLTGQVTRLGYVRGAGEATPEKPGANLTGDEYFTDGLRAVVFLGSPRDAVFHAFTGGTRILDWDHTPAANRPRHIDFVR